MRLSIHYLFLSTLSLRAFAHPAQGLSQPLTTPTASLSDLPALAVRQGDIDWGTVIWDRRGNDGPEITPKPMAH